MTHNIEYKINAAITAEDFVSVLKASKLGKRRPVEDMECMKGMVQNADLTITAWDKNKLIGIARSVTDFHYCCYLSDIAVDDEYQKTGIGKQLIRLTKKNLGAKCILILLSAPAATKYYPHIGFQKHPQSWILNPEDDIR
jgi:predicted N-acetyltransferase YhbS